MDKDILFRYSLTDAWASPLCDVSVSPKGEVQYREGQEEYEYCTLDVQSLEMIENTIETHSSILDYESFELESPNVLDGVMNFFDFSTQEGKRVHLMAFNIGEVRNPNASFSEGLLAWSKKETVKHNIVPVKAMNVIEAFDEIAKVLIKNGVSPKCLRLTYQ